MYMEENEEKKVAHGMRALHLVVRRTERGVDDEVAQHCNLCMVRVNDTTSLSTASRLCDECDPCAISR